jgi:hypothetical protein
VQTTAYRWRETPVDEVKAAMYPVRAPLILRAITKRLERFLAEGYATPVLVQEIRDRLDRWERTGR